MIPNLSDVKLYEDSDDEPVNGEHWFVGIWTEENGYRTGEMINGWGESPFVSDNRTLAYIVGDGWATYVELHHIEPIAKITEWIDCEYEAVPELQYANSHKGSLASTRRYLRALSTLLKAATINIVAKLI